MAHKTVSSSITLTSGSALEKYRVRVSSSFTVTSGLTLPKQYARVSSRFTVSSLPASDSGELSNDRTPPRTER